MKLIFKSLINNAACVTGARKKGKWWVAIILFFVSVIIALVPSFVNAISTQGSSRVLSSSYYGLDLAFVDFADSNRNDLKLIFDEDHKLKAYDGSDTPVPETLALYMNQSDSTCVAFIYKENMDSTYVNNMLAIVDKAYSCIFFSDNSLYMSIVAPEKPGKIAFSEEFVNPWKDFKSGTNLFDFLLDSSLSTDEEKYEYIRTSLPKFFDNAYNYLRVNSALLNTGVMALVDVVIIVLMGTMVWILTRGKQNAFRHFKYYDALKITAWGSLSPALLSLLFGFLFSGTAGMAFPLLLGVRSMWLCSKTLRPDGLGYEEPKEVQTVNVKSK